jgi:uncharacterized membrane protein
VTIAETETRQKILGYAAALGAAACYGTLAVLGKKVVSDIAPPLVATSFSMVIGTIILVAIFQQQIRQDLIVRPALKGWVFVTLAGVSATWGVTFWYMALNHAPAVLVAPIASIHPVFSVLITLIFLRKTERVSMKTVLGAVLVTCGVVIITLSSQWPGYNLFGVDI